MYAAKVEAPAWVGEAVGTPKIWPVVIEHRNGFEPGILHEIDGVVWRNEVPYRMTLVEATQAATRMLESARGI